MAVDLKEGSLMVFGTVPVANELVPESLRGGRRPSEGVPPLPHARDDVAIVQTVKRPLIA
jgi:hypothetical protein